ncbi:hypothetical protein JXJ21_16240, partial [candidate division KSB1 bacterium]|nr:hypothetical protein [candidate division KSB1 bacterium]
VTFLIKHNYVNLLNKIDREKCGILSLNEEHINRFGLPAKKVLDTVRRLEFNLVIDLNYDFNITSTYICYISGANLRICLWNKKRDPFFNFQITTKSDENIESKYRSFLKYLTINVKSDAIESAK